ncbi:NAD(P)/FAD-dependent oxidoreductase [Streptacidiphilus monticola]
MRAGRPQALHHRWSTWQRLRPGPGTTLLTEHHVWFAERLPQGFALHALLGPDQERGATVHADGLLLATGGYETLLPFPGWTLPGVLTAGGAQAMLKGSLVLPGRNVVVAGTGPLLLPVATGLAGAGARVAALVESTRPRDALPHAVRLAGRPAALGEAATYAARLARHRVPVLAGHTVLRAHGEERVEAVTVAALGADGRSLPGTERRIACDTLAVSHGMRPHTDLADALGCALDGLRVAVDDEQRTDVPGVWAAGEATGVGGAPLAVAEGRVAGLSAAARLRGLALSCPRARSAPVPRCAASRTRWTPSTARPRAGPRSCPTTPSSAAARR